MSGTTLRNQIRRLRFEHGDITQEALARTVGVTRQTIIALEAGRYAPSLELAFRIARAFGVALEAVFQDPASESASDAGGTATRGPEED